MMSDETRYDPLIQRALAGEEAALAELFDEHRGRLERMVVLRMDSRLRGRLDASDVLQEAYLDLARQLPAYAEQPKLPFFNIRSIEKSIRSLNLYGSSENCSSRL